MKNNPDSALLFRLLNYKDESRQREVQKCLKELSSRLRVPKKVTRDFADKAFKTEYTHFKTLSRAFDHISKFLWKGDPEALKKVEELSCDVRKKPKEIEIEERIEKAEQIFELARSYLQSPYLTDLEEKNKFLISVFFRLHALPPLVIGYLRDSYPEFFTDEILSEEDLLYSLESPTIEEFMRFARLLPPEDEESDEDDSVKEELDRDESDESSKLGDATGNNSDKGRAPAETVTSEATQTLQNLGNAASEAEREIAEKQGGELSLPQERESKAAPDFVSPRSDLQKERIENLKKIKTQISQKLQQKTDEPPQQAAPINLKSMVTGVLRAFKNGGAFNYYPLCRWENGYPRPITNAKELYPERANILFGETSKLTRTELNRLRNGILLNVEFSDDELYPTEFDNLSRRTLDISSFFRERKIEQACSDERDNGYWKAFYIVEPETSATDNLSFDRRVNVRVDGLPNLRPELSDLVKGQMVVVKHNNRYYGPFPLREDSSQQLYVAPANQSGTRGIVKYYIEKEDSLGNAIYRTEGINPLVNLRYLFTNPLLVEQKEVDTISDETLLREVVKKMGLDNQGAEIISDWMSEHINNSFFDNDISLTPSRVKRLLDYFEKNLSDNKHLDQLVELIDKALISVAKSRPDLFELIYEKAMSNPDVLKGMQVHKMAQEKLKTLEKQIDDLNNTLKVLENQKKNKEAQLAKKAKKSELDKQIEKLEERLHDLKGISDLRTTITKTQEEQRSLNVDVNRAKEELDKLKAERAKFNEQLESFDKRIQETATTVSNLAFDGEVTAKILEAANRWSGARSKEAIQGKISFLRSIQKNEAEGKSLNNQLINRLSQFRDYDRNEFTNIFICLAQSFLTVFSGTPGSGKTSMCNLLATVLGLNSLSKQKGARELWGEKVNLANRYLPISVEKGWTSKRDLIGYYNPLTRRFESQDPHRYECFIQLNAEANINSFDLPYFILLDEANLSPMEYYFADFMNICDERNEFSSISLGGDYSYRIPDTLRFLATINNDHTTENLSPRLIDRAWLITLPDTEKFSEHSVSEVLETTQTNPINWQSFLRTFGQQKERSVSPGVKSLMTEARRAFTKLGVTVSPRTLFAMENYVGSASLLMDAQEGQSPELVGLDYAIAQKLLPKINGVGDTYQDQLNEIHDWLSSVNLKKSEKVLGSIIDRGAQQMDYYGFF